MKKIIYFTTIITIAALGGHILARVIESIWLVLPLAMLWGYGIGYFGAKIWDEFFENPQK